MRVSRQLLVTLREVPADCEIASHQLLVRGNFIRRVASGIYAYMPMMWKVLKKITCIVEEEMAAADCLETLLPQLHPSELWERTGRWEGYTQGEGIMFHLKDRQGRDLGLGPTHEEVATSLAKELIRSYKQLPVCIYQIQTKFRDEIRPRFGLMRSREFIMKDAYSFHSNEKNLKEKYDVMNNAYRRIFARCGIETVAVDADSGAIGGSASQEFMVTANSGEDLILISTDGLYAANQEKATSIAPEAKDLEYLEESYISTPNQNSINELCSKQDLDPSQIVKVIIYLAIFDDETEQPILISIRGDQEVNDIKLSNFLEINLNKKIVSLSTLSQEKLVSQGIKEIPFGSIGPDLKDLVLEGAKSWENKFLRIADHTAADLKKFVCGSNKLNSHRICISWESSGGLPQKADIRKANPGDRCVHDSKVRLIAKRGIEVGHIFQLGRKYSEALEANFTNEEGINEPYWMGCYGIGISRLAQAAVEQHHDDSGICWPLAIAPFEVIIVPANNTNETQRKLSEQLYKNLLEVGIDVLLDDRDERAGVKFKDADLIGIPWRIVIGRDSENGNVELVERAKKKTLLLSFEQATQKLLEEICLKKG